MLNRLVSGGQTGVDRAALDVAIALQLDCGGWCPLGRKAEDGVVPDRYPLRETPGADYLQRTGWNVRDSDATLVLTRGDASGGTAATIRLAGEHDKPCLVIDLLTDPDPVTVRDWLRQHRIDVLNVAGPRESHRPGIHREAYRFLLRCLSG